MKPAPTQHEVKSLFSLLIPHGNRKLIAQGMGVSEGDISRRFNPNDDRKLGTAEGLLEQYHIIQTSPTEWLTIRALIESLWDEWETQGRLPVPSAARVAKEQSDYVTAELQGLSPDRKGMELAQSIAYSKRRLAHIEAGGGADNVEGGMRKVG
jgi:hypothetical protein